MTAPASGDKAAKTRGELLTGPVFPMVVKFGVPTMVSMLTPAIYNLTGAYFVSTLGTTAVAALGIVFSLHMILAAVGIMTGQGCASQTSRLLGAGEYEAAGFIAGTGILLSVLGGVAIGVLGLLFDEPLLRVLGATPTIMPDAVRYAEVLLIGSPVVCASFTFNNLLRSEGLAVVGMRRCSRAASSILRSRPPSSSDWASASRARPGPPSSPRRRVCSSSSITTAGRRGSSRIIPPTLERLRRLSPTILRNGMPSLLRNALAAVAASILNLTAGGFGDAAVAAMSIVSRVLMTVNAVMVGLGQGYQPVAGFNWGAGNYARVKKALVSTIVAGTAFTTAAAIPGFIFSESIVSVFAGGDPR
ncbi:MAG: MATE family efflux transporter [Sutterella wadsworthensis]